MESISSAEEPLDLDSIRSRIIELEEIHRSCRDDLYQLPEPDSENLVKDCVLHLESKLVQLVSEYSDVESLGNEDLDAYVEHLKEELSKVVNENDKISNEVDVLMKNVVEDSNHLECDLEGLKSSLDFFATQGLGLRSTKVGCAHVEEQLNLTNVNGENQFEILKYDSQIEKNKSILKCLEDLDCICKRFDAEEQIEDALTGLKVIEFDASCIRLSMKTYIPKLDFLFSQQNIEETLEPSELNHELLIEVLDGTMDIKNVEIFPTDVYIVDIVDAAKSFRQLFPQLAVLERSALEWFVRKVQERIILRTLTRLVVQSAQKSRHSFEYLERDETIIAHMVGGIDAFIKLSQGWPVSISPLKLISLKSSDRCSSGVSLSFLCKVEEVVNSLDINLRQSLSSFLDAVEKILMEQMCLELQSNDAASGN